MKIQKILYCLMAFVFGMTLAGCSDDDLGINTSPLLSDGSVVTGTADVTSTTATFYGSVKGLEGQSTSAYTCYFMYGTSENALTEKAPANSAETFSSTITGAVGSTVYYQAYVTLQNTVSYKGEVKSCVLTNAKALTGAAIEVAANSMLLSGTSEQLTQAEKDAAKCGIIISGAAASQPTDEARQESARSGVRIYADKVDDAYNVLADGLLPGTTYTYTSFVDLGNGIVYGETKTFTTPSVTFDPDNDLVDLGLSTKWAKYNVGALSAEENGGYFGFGDVTGYNASVSTDDYASADIYKTDRDVANKVYSSWVTMPTVDEMQELFSSCNTEWVEMGDVKGYKISSKTKTDANGDPASIFLPAAGSRTQSSVSDKGTMGMYLSGSVNPANAQMAQAFSFDQSGTHRVSVPVYQALSVRPVSVAKNVKFNKEYLYNTWAIDLRLNNDRNGYSHYKFEGPVYFYGSNDSWKTITNNQPVTGDSWAWAPDYEGNKWAIGGGNSEKPEEDYGPMNCQGTMQFYQGEDGKDYVKVTQYTYVETEVDGNQTRAYTATEYNGTFTVDEENKTVRLSIEPLIPASYAVENSVKEAKDIDLRIFSLTDESMQLGVFRASDNQTLAINYVPQDCRDGYVAQLMAYGDGDGNTWNTATCAVFGGDKCDGTYTVTLPADGAPRSNGKVVCLDLKEFHKYFPNAIVEIESIQCDGKDVPFDGNKFFYGDIEGNGNYRIEMANIWGKGNYNWNGLADTPFKDGGGVQEGGAPELAFSDNITVTFRVVSHVSDGTGTYTPKLTTVSSWWGSTWGTTQGASFDVKFEDNKYTVSQNVFDITYNASDAPSNYNEGSIMTFVQIDNVYGYFPQLNATLNNIWLDGNEVSFDDSKVLNSNENPAYRLELWNTYGATRQQEAYGFGTPEGDVVKGLAFSNTMRTKMTVNGLFKKPAGWR